MKHVPTHDPHEAEMAMLASELPDGSALPETAWRAILDLNDAVLRSDLDAVKQSISCYEACIWKLNGNTFFGSAADAKQAAEVIATYCQADKGQVPLWGQKGEFLVVSETGVRAWVKVEQSRHYCSAGYNVIDLDKPFMSHTGYRHVIFKYAYSKGETVSEYLTRTLDELLNATKKPEYLDPTYRNSLAREPLPEWLADLKPCPCRLPETLPAGFVRVEAVLPAAKAFMARKWSDAAQERIQALLKQQAEDTEESEAPSPSVAPKKIYKGGLTTVEQYREFYVGALCEIVSVHHPVFNRLIGNRVKIVTIYDCGTIAAHDDKPVVTRVNRRGNTVVVSDPRTIRSFYGAEQLKLITPEKGNADNG